MTTEEYSDPLSMQVQGEEGQCPPGAESGEGREWQQKGLVGISGLKDWKKASVTHILKMHKKDQRNYRLVILTCISGKVMEQVTLEIIFKYVRDKKVIESS